MANIPERQVFYKNDSSTGEPSGIPLIFDFITDAQYQQCMLAFGIISSFLGVVGMATNSVNICIFWAMGLKDSVAVNLFSLSILDFGVTLASVVSGTSRYVRQLPVFVDSAIWFRVEPVIPLALSVNTRTSFVCGSFLLTTFLAVQRCCCVVLPFIFRRVFTRKLTVVTVCVIGAFTLLFVAAFGSLYHADWKFVPALNRSQIHLLRRAHRDVLIHYLFVICVFAVTLGCQSIIIISLVFMLIGLKRSIQFKKTSQVVTASHQGVSISNEKNENQNNSMQSELRLMKTVFLIAALLVVCNTPGCSLCIIRMSYPGFDVERKGMRNSYAVTSGFVSLCQVFNSSVNLFVYLYSSSSFHKTFMKILRKV